MAYNPENFNTLKLKMMQEKEIIDVFSFFFDYFAEEEEFFDHSIPTSHELLESIIGELGGHLYGVEGKAVLSHFTLLTIPDQQFYHGGCMINGVLTTYIYFDDIKTGCIGALTSLSDPTQFMRFSTSIARDPNRAPSD